MKRTFKTIMFVAAAAMAFTACNIEPVQIPEETTGTHTVKFVASQVGTKTTMDINNGIASFDWEEVDVDYFHIFENEYSNKATDYAADIDENGAMQLMATFENGGTAPFTYFGFFAPTFFTYPQVPAAQTDNGKYDPMADILIAKPVTADASQSEEILSFQFKRIVAINIMTLKGLTEGETVSEVKIVSDKPIAGKYDHTKDEWYNSTDTQITVSANSVANKDGQAVVYFVSAPVENAQLSITATTSSGKTYSKELAKTISFTEGGVKAFGVTVEEDVEEYEEHTVSTTINDIVSSNDYTVSSGNDVYDIITEIQLDEHLVMSTNGSANSGSFWGTTTYDWRLYQTTGANLMFTVDDGYYIKSVKVTYTNSNNGSLYDGENTLASNAVDEDINMPFVEYGVRSTTSGKTNGQVRITSVEVVYAKGEVTIISVTGVTLDESVLTLEVGDEATLTETVNPDNAANKKVTWSSSDEDVVTVEDGAVTAVGVGEATITVTTVDGAFTATCDVTVNAAPVKEYSSLAELIAAGEPTEAGIPVTVTLTDVVIESIFVTSQGYRNGVYLKVPDTDKKIELYCYDVPEDWEAFGKLSGTLTECTWKKFNSTTWELCPEDWDDLDYTAPVKYNVVPPTGLVGGTVSADIYEAAAGATVTLTATPSTGYQFVSWSVKDESENEVTVTNNAFTMPASDVTVSATFEGIPTHTVTLATCTNGSVSATINGEPLVSGSAVREGTEINITATPASDSYVFSSWNITGATAATATASTTIAVGTDNIVIAAEFDEKSTDSVYTLVSSLSSMTAGTYVITAFNSSKYYTVPATTISGQIFTCLESTYSNNTLTPANGSGIFEFIAVEGKDNAFYIYNTTLKEYLVATGSKTFGYVKKDATNYGYWTFSTVTSGGFSGLFSVEHSSKKHYMRAYNNSVRCYDGTNNNGVYLFKLSN